jgi:hypothetical protein
MDGSGTMTAASPGELAVRIEAVVRGTSGVRNVYRSGSLISNLLRAGAAALGARGDDEPIVSVVSGPGGVAVGASIGIDVGSPAAAVLRAVHEAVDALLRADGLLRESITLTVVYVQPREAS